MSPSYYSLLLDSLEKRLSDQSIMINLVSDDKLCTIIHLQSHQPLSIACGWDICRLTEEKVVCNQAILDRFADCHYLLTVFKTKAREYRLLSAPP